MQKVILIYSTRSSFSELTAMSSEGRIMGDTGWEASQEQKQVLMQEQGTQKSGPGVSESVHQCQCSFPLCPWCPEHLLQPIPPGSCREVGVWAHTDFPSLFLSQSYMAVSSVVTEPICGENSFLDLSLEMEVQLLRDRL